MTSNIAVLYHKGCPDGFTAAWAAWQIYPDAQFIPVRHHEPFPDGLEGKDIFILDFCYPRDEMEELNEIANTLFCLDHHKTAYEQCGEIKEEHWDPEKEESYEITIPALEYCHFDMNKSGAGLAWEFFHNDKPLPWLIEYVQYRDLGFLWTRPKSEHPKYLEEVLAAVDSYEKSFEQWDKFGEDTFEYAWREEAIGLLVAEGEAILRYKKQLIDSAVRNATEVTIKGKKALAVNSCHFQSEIGNLLARQEGSELGVVWYEGHDKVKFSLRSIDEKADASEVAEQFDKGGGHRNAAGFAIKTQPTIWDDHNLDDHGDRWLKVFIPGWKDD